LLKFGAKLDGYTFDSKQFLDVLAGGILEQMHKGAASFVRVATASVPVRTGFAVGTFQNILDAIGGTTTPLAINAARRVVPKVRSASRQARLKSVLFPDLKRGINTKKVPKIPVEYYRGSGGKILKTPNSGRQFATPPGEVFKQSGMTFTFTFDIDITYFNINDVNVNKHTPSAPWLSFARGSAFYITYMRQNALMTMYEINDYLIVDNYVVSPYGTAHTKSTAGRDPIIKVT
jgi:hypothetical protein